jgi:hypothetical protein
VTPARGTGELLYFTAERSPSLWRSSGPGHAERWRPRRRAWEPAEDNVDGMWLSRAWGFGGWTKYDPITEEDARRRFPSAFAENS